jgi:hypothetical protein
VNEEPQAEQEPVTADASASEPATVVTPPESAFVPPEPAPPPPPFQPPPSPTDGGVAHGQERPEVAVGAAFAGGFVLALILKRLAR